VIGVLVSLLGAAWSRVSGWAALAALAADPKNPFRNMHEAAAAFSIDVDLDDDISEAAFRAALEDELGPGGADAIWTITGRPATDSEYRGALESGLIPQPAVG